MNILILINTFPPEIRSASHLFHELSESLVNKGHKVTVVTGFPRYNVEKIDRKYKGRFLLCEVMDGIQVIRLATIQLPKNIPMARGIDHLLLSILYSLGGLISGNQDVILVYSPPLFLGISAYLLSKVKKFPFIFNVQDIWPKFLIDLGILKNTFLIKLFKVIEKFIYKKARYITVHSEGNQNYLISNGAAPNKVFVIPNWVDTKLIFPTDKFNEFRKENNLGDKFIVSFAGVMNYGQDIETIIDSASLLKDKGNKKIFFLLVGDGVEKERVKKKAEDLNLNNVKFLPFQPKQKYPQVLNASDVCLVTLRKEITTPVVPGKLLSIMASGRPVVASLPLDGDAPKIIKKAKCGYSVEPESPEKLAEAILRLYNNPNLMEKFGKNGRQYAENYFSRTVCVEKYERLFMQADWAEK